MRLRLNEKVICIEESAVIVLFVCLLSKIAREYLSNYYLCFLFITFHELSHITIAVLFGGSVKRVNIRISGLSVNILKNFSGIRAVLVYLAGPLSNIILAMLFRNIDIIFEINMCLALINLVPIKPLDGYNILNVILDIIISRKTKNMVLKIVSIIAEIMLIFLSVLLIVKYCNISLIILLLYIKIINLKSA